MGQAHANPVGGRPAKWGTFVELPENRLALAATRSLAKALRGGRRPPVIPLVLHGPPGTGKSHLTGELLCRITEGQSVLTARLVSVGDIARTEAGLADRDLAACDLLVLEDVQHLPARDAEAFCALLDRRLARRRGTVITAHAGPAQLRHLPRLLTSRLAAGLVMPLEPLGPASRRVVLETRAQLQKLRLTADALDWLAEQSTGGGVRPLIGMLQSLAAAGAPGGPPLDRGMVRELLASTGRPATPKRDVSRIVRQVAAAYGVTQKELLGPSRLRRVMVPRQVAMYLARELCGLSLPRLGSAFGGRDHTTVLHACRKVEAEADRDAALAGLVRQLRNELA
jgi:chromosomal replication initiator protein